MSSLANGIPPDVLQALGWALLHFAWQGTVLAGLFAVANALFRRATARYALGVLTLVLMVAAPAITLMVMLQQKDSAVRSGAQEYSAGAAPPARATTTRANSSAPVGKAPAAPQAGGMLWFVEAWFLGVVLLSLRTAGGLLLIERMRRREIRPVTRALREKCLELQRRMGIERLIRYCECLRLGAPAVMGWFRPIVLLPARALAGLTEEQIEAVIAHELAHIRRLDCFVNLFQIAVETLLFYHPAVWWVNGRIRAERENCCDDEAIAVCGDAVNYARALTLMEEWRAVPSVMMAANRGPLAERVARLLGLGVRTDRIRAAGMVAGFVCLVGALLAGNAFFVVAHAALSSRSSFAPGHQERGEIARGSTEAGEQPSLEAVAQEVSKDNSKGAKGQAKDEKKDEQKPSETSGQKESYIDAMAAAGFKDLTVDDLIAMKVQGVTPAYVKEIHELGLRPSAEEIVGMRVQGITPQYIREMRAIEPGVDVDTLIGMKVQGLTPQYSQEMRGLGFEADGDQLIGFKVQGITAEFVRQMQAAGLKPNADDLIGMKVQGITPEYVREMQATGLKPGTDDLIGMKVQGITPEYVKGLQAAGFKDLDCDELIGAKVQGITAEYIEKARKHGFQNLTLEKLIELKRADIL